MDDILRVDICVIGAGSGGLSVAAGAAQLGAATALIERAHMGGDCLNFGCVPSKALLAAAHAAAGARRAAHFGVLAGDPRIDDRAVYAHVRRTIAAIAPNDSVERFEGLGVKVIRAAARFLDPETITAGGTRIRARRFVIATGSSPLVPPIAGLASVPHLTNETIFGLDRLPARLLIIGGGPIGIEMAQAHRRLGSAVTVIEAATILPRDDPELVDVVRQRLRREGVVIREGAKVVRVAADAAGGVAATIATDGGEERIAGSHLLVAAGRQPTIDGLDLERAGVAHERRGIAVDAGLRTTNRRIYAIGDVAGGFQFTHMASHHAAVVIRNALFRLPARVETRAVPWVTYTAPELAQVGMTEAQATAAAMPIRILRWPFAENDRAQAEAETDGLVKAVVTPKGAVLGAGIVGARAGEMISAWGLAIRQGIGVKDLAQQIVPYPTFGEASKRAAGSFFAAQLFGERTRRLVRFLSRFG